MAKIVQTAGRNALGTFAPEFAQYFIMRNTAVDDIILNTLGAICGYWVYRLLRKMFPDFSRKFICNITQATGN